MIRMILLVLFLALPAFAQSSGGGGKLPGVTVTDTPTTGEVLTATGTTAASWQAASGASRWPAPFREGSRGWDHWPPCGTLGSLPASRSR